MPAPPSGPTRYEELEPATRTRIDQLLQDGRTVWERFDEQVRSKDWHPFMPAEYEQVLDALVALRHRGGRFLEWGSATGVIAIAADILGFDAFGIEFDPALVTLANDLAARHHSTARFAAGSFLPDDYVWQSDTGDHRTGTIEQGPSGYPALGLALQDFNLVYGYPWSGEEPLMHDVMRRCGKPGAVLLINRTGGVHAFR